MTGDFPVAVSIPTCSTAVQIDRDIWNGDSSPTKTGTADTTSLCAMKNVSQSLGRSWNMKTPFSPSRYHSYNPFRNCLLYATFGMIRKFTKTACTSSGRESRLR